MLDLTQDRGIYAGKLLAEMGAVTTLYIEPGSPWENGYNELFNGKLQDELLKREIFMALAEAKILAERWRYEHNHIRPHSSLNGSTPKEYAEAAIGL